MAGCRAGAMFKVLGSMILGIPSRTGSAGNVGFQLAKWGKGVLDSKLAGLSNRALICILKRFKLSILYLFVISALISFPFCLKNTLTFEIIIVPQLLQQTYCTGLAPSVPFLHVKSPFSSRVTLVQGLMVVYEELSFEGTHNLQYIFFFPSYSVKLFPGFLLQV